jgi:hypothetical protein
MLGRLRASARLAVLVLLVFAMKIGLAAACAKHDFADLGLASDASHQVMVSAAVDTDGNEPGKGPLPHAGACSHCSCHHASALPNETILAFAVVPRETVGYRSGVLPSAAPRLELRPPIV